MIKPIAGNSSREVNFNLLVKQTGFISGVIELEDDPLTEDNQGFFTFFLPDKIKLLLYGDSEDLRFFQLALAPDLDRQELFSFIKTA